MVATTTIGKRLNSDRRAKAVLVIDGTLHALGLLPALGNDFRQQRSRSEVPADQRIDVRMARQQRSIAMEHGDRGVLSERHRRKELLELGRSDGARNDAQKFAMRPDDLAGNDRFPPPEKRLRTSSICCSSGVDLRVLK